MVINWFHVGLATLMLITGSINTLSVKWADTMKAESTDGQERGFIHPFLQACGMFLGEMSCLWVFFIIRWYRKHKIVQNNMNGDTLPTENSSTNPEISNSFSPFIFLPPALCDMTATSAQYIGLTLTYASSFQMLRGAVIVFTGLFSTFFLRRRLEWFRWAGIGFVILGLTIVGLTDILYTDTGNNNNTTLINSSDPNQTLFHTEYFGYIIRGRHLGNSSDQYNPTEILIGDVLIVCAQVIVATQMVYEEKFIYKYNVPALQAVGWEGTFGFLTLSLLLIPFYFIPVGSKFGNNPRHVLEDAYDGLYQLSHNSQLAGAFSLTIISIAFFNFAGISVTKELSATTRMVLDSVRTLVIWSVSLLIQWQKFQWLQLVGFLVLVTGMLVYNNIFIVPGIMEILYLTRCLDRPGSYYTLQNEIEDDIGTSTSSDSNGEPETNNLEQEQEISA